MGDTSCCPADEALLPLLADEAVPAEVRAHLDSCAPCRQRLEQFRADLEELRTASRPDTTLPTHELAGRGAAPRPRPRPAMIGKYLIVGALESGGQSHVYRGLHPLLDKELAIKLSRRPVGEDSETRHFLVAEGKILAGLEHPNLARVYDLDFHEDRPFLAMEYVRGSDLRGYTGGAPLAPQRAARLVAEVARALAVVHRHGILHQDIKPQNILIDPDGRTRLIDFGLARLRHAWDDGPEGPSGGTPAFMAPEQARGETAAMGPRSDLFSLGAVLYFLLTAQAPFAAADPVASLERAARCDFDRAALRRAGVPRRLEAICLKAMASRPEDRHTRAEDLAEDLERYVQRPQRFGRAALALAAALLLALGVWWLGRSPGPATLPARDVAEIRVEVEREGRYLDLAAALPLDAATDRVQVVGKVPPGLHAVMLYVDPRGKVKRLPVEESSADAFTRLVFPGEGGKAPLEADAPGTEFVLVCAARSRAELEGLEDLVASTLAPPLPRLPPKVLIRLDRDQPSRQSRPFGEPEPDPAAQTETRLDHLRQRLRSKGIPVIQGVAFAH